MARKYQAARRRRDYKVGKGKPPKETQWKPGQSGNPKGRPRGSRNILTMFNEALQLKVQIQERGTLRTITVREAIVRKLISQGLKGDLKAISFVLAKEPEIARYLPPREKVDTSNMSAEELTKRYQRLIKQVVACTRFE